MIQKNHMRADLEQLTYDADKLKSVWKEISLNAKPLVEARWTSHHLLTFIDWINQNTYSGILFPGFSLGKLLISKPRNGKLNYQQTLAIAYDNQTELFRLQYSDWDTITSQDEYEKAIQWTAKCPGTDLCTNFLEFLKWKSNWD